MPTPGGPAKHRMVPPRAAPALGRPAPQPHDAEELQDALLDRRQIGMLFVERPPRRAQIEAILGHRQPRQLDEPGQVRAHHLGLGTLRRHRLQPPELPLRLDERLASHARGPDLLAQLAQFVAAAIELGVDLAQLLTQEVLALGAAQDLFGAGADAFLQVEQLQLASQKRRQEAQAHRDLGGLQDALGLFGRDVEVGRHHVGETLGHSLVEAVQAAR